MSMNRMRSGTGMLTPPYWTDIPLIAGLLKAIFRPVEARYNEIRFAADCVWRLTACGG